MKFIVQTDRYTQTNTRTHMHARIRTQAQVPECLCPPLSFFKTTLTLLFSPFLHAQRHAWQAQLNRDPTERPNSISLASLCRTGSPKPIKTSVAMHVTVLSMCSVQDKTCVIVPCSEKKVEGDSLQPLIYSHYDSREEKPSERIAFDVKAGTNLFHLLDFHVSRC